MKVKITYPVRSARPFQRNYMLSILRWPFLLAAYICPILNLATGAPAWSIVVLWSLWLVWSLALSPDLVEYNRISQPIKVVTDAAVLLILIDLILSPGWAVEVVPIVCFGGLAISGVLLFTDFDKQKQNMLPMLLLIAVALISAIVGLIVWRDQPRWSLVVMGALALALFIACFLVLGGDMLREIRKRFHTK